MDVLLALGSSSKEVSGGPIALGISLRPTCCCKFRNFVLTVNFQKWQRIPFLSQGIFQHLDPAHQIVADIFHASPFTFQKCNLGLSPAWVFNRANLEISLVYFPLVSFSFVPPPFHLQKVQHTRQGVGCKRVLIWLGFHLFAFLLFEASHGNRRIVDSIGNLLV